MNTDTPTIGDHFDLASAHRISSAIRQLDNICEEYAGTPHIRERMEYVKAILQGAPTSPAHKGGVSHPEGIFGAVGDLQEAVSAIQRILRRREPVVPPHASVKTEGELPQIFINMHPFYYTKGRAYDTHYSVLIAKGNQPDPFIDSEIGHIGAVNCAIDAGRNRLEAIITMYDATSAWADESGEDPDLEKRYDSLVSAFVGLVDAYNEKFNKIKI